MSQVRTNQSRQPPDDDFLLDQRGKVGKILFEGERLGRIIGVRMDC
jgi:hypothetical protein